MNLSKISEFSEKQEDFSNRNKLVLDRKPHKSDEFDTVVDSINKMHLRLSEQVCEIDQQRQYLFQTLNSIGDAVITTDKSGNVERMNPIAEELTEWSNEEAEGLPLSKIFPIINASTGDTIENPVDKVMSTGETMYLSNHTTLISKSGLEHQIADSAAPIISEGEVLGAVLVFNDVTEQYRVREALHESEEILRQLAENLNEVFWLGSTSWDKIFYVSPAYERNWGLNAEELYSNPRVWLEVVHPEDREQVISDIPVNLSDIGTCVDFNEYRVIKPNGEIIFIKARAYPVLDSNGEVVRIAGIAEDITIRKEQEEKLRRAQKMDALGKLTGGIAHDYNNMLGVVLGYSELLKLKLNDQPEILGYVHEIHRAAERGSKLTRKLLSFSSNQIHDATVFSINDLIKNERDMLEKTLTARIKLKFDCAKELNKVLLDESELEDVILNICINAMHAMKQGGELLIQTSNELLKEREAEALEIKCGEYVLLKISDTGCGMDELTKEKIFDPFYSTKGAKGTGLGLTQVYGFIKKSKGAIQVDSEVNKGTSFTLYFPRCEDKYNEFENDKVHEERLGGLGTILVVDDEHALLKLTCDILELHGYKTKGSLSAEDALKTLEVEVIDLLITDVIMPDMDGYELAEIVKKKHPDVKIQMVSGFAGEHNSENTDSQLHKRLLSKPYSSEELLLRIKALL